MIQPNHGGRRKKRGCVGKGRSSAILCQAGFLLIFCPGLPNAAVDAKFGRISSSFGNLAQASVKGEKDALRKKF